MYICVKSNENLEKTIQSLLRANLMVDVSRHETLTWIDVNLKDYGYYALVRFYSKELSIFSKEDTSKDILTISFDDLETIYELD